MLFMTFMFHIHDNLVALRLSVDLEKETINLAGSDTTPASALSGHVPTDQARYHLYVFSHQYEGDVFHSLGEWPWDSGVVVEG